MESTRKPLTPEQKARYALTKRLKRAHDYMQKAAEQLKEIHADRSGMYSYLPPAHRPTLRAVSTVRELLANIEQDAAGGCARCADFLLEHAEQIGWIEYQARKNPPKRDPDYRPQPMKEWGATTPAPWRDKRAAMDDLEADMLHEAEHMRWR